MKKSLLAVFMSLAMIVSLTACGGGGSSEPAAEAAEPNSGLRGIVFAVPDGWAVEGVGENFVSYKTKDSPVTLHVSAMDQDDISGFEDEDSSLTVQEYFDKNYKASDEDIKKYDLEQKDIKVCDTDGLLVSRKVSGGYAYKSAAWMLEDTIYSIGLSNYDNYDDKGELKDDAVALTSDEEALLDGVLASVKPGDGEALKKQSLNADSVGALSFTAPEGFELTNVGDGFVSFEKGEVTLNFNRTTEEDFEKWSWEGDDAPKSVEEMFRQNAEWAEAATIAGSDGFIDKTPDENGKYYSVSARVMVDGVLYEVNMGTDAYDENGLKEDAVALTDEDLAAFDAFVASLTKK